MYQSRNNVPLPTATWSKRAFLDSTEQWVLANKDAPTSIPSLASNTANPPKSKHKDAPVSMDASRAKPGSISSSSSHSDSTISPLSPIVLRHGRRYLRDLPYPLPCDLPELHRQTLHTILATSVFGKVLCSPSAVRAPPRRVLEIACGSGYWTTLCHEYLAGYGHSNVSFTGLDIIRLAPDLRKQGVNWRFVQHDLRRLPLPFEDEEFDLVVLKDLGLVVPLGVPSERMLDEAIRVLRSGGTIEVQESDHIIRSLLPHPPPLPGKSHEEWERATTTGTFLISPATPFREAPNIYLREMNGWIRETFDRRKLCPTPGTRVDSILKQETDTLCDFGSQRVAIPLGEPRWERETDADRVPRRKARNMDTSCLTEEQAALRYTALLVVIQMIESLEPLLKEVSGKSQEEWQRWWAWMMSDLLENKGASSGECLEMGAWWARKL